MELLRRHQGRLLAIATVLGFSGLIWLDARRETRHAGDALPDVKLHVLGGESEVSLSALTGKPVVLDFWASWCGPCLRALPGIDRMAKARAGEVAFYAVNADDEAPEVQLGQRDKLGLLLPMLSDGAKLAARLHVDRLPTTIVADREGRIVRTFEGPVAESSLERLLDELK